MDQQEVPSLRLGSVESSTVRTISLLFNSYGKKMNTKVPEPLTTSSATEYFGKAKEIIRTVWVDHDSEKSGKNNSDGWFTRLKRCRC